MSIYYPRHFATTWDPTCSSAIEFIHRATVELVNMRYLYKDNLNQEELEVMELLKQFFAVQEDKLYQSLDKEESQL